MGLNNENKVWEVYSGIVIVKLRSHDSQDVTVYIKVRSSSVPKCPWPAAPEASQSPNPQTLNPKHLNPKPYILNPKP